MPELLVDGRAQLSVVRHGPGCPTLLAQVLTALAHRHPTTSGTAMCHYRACGS